MGAWDAALSHAAAAPGGVIGLRIFQLLAMLLHALGTEIVAEKSFGMPSDVGLDRHPAALLVPDFLARAAEGQQP